jgi:hypothetical protein
VSVFRDDDVQLSHQRLGDRPRRLVSRYVVFRIDSLA